MSFEWPATQRYRLAPAPGGLGLVQDFLNTIDHQPYGPDLLGDAALANAWAAKAVPAWSASRGVDAGVAGWPPALSDADVPKLHALRDTIAKLVAGESVTGGAVPASLALSETGEMGLEPAGTGWRWYASALWAEILLSQQDGTWRRIKRCHNHPCVATFYDRSKNSSGVWCNVKICGNSANLRASRARRRERERAAEIPTS